MFAREVGERKGRGEKKKTFNATDRNKITVELKSWGQREG